MKPWFESLELPGAVQMSYVRALMESRPILERVPDQSLVTDAGSSASERIQATRGKDYAFVYSVAGEPFTVNLGKISGNKVKAYWYDPRTGETMSIGEKDNKGTQSFTPPTAGNGQDWVLIMDDASKNYKKPEMIRTVPF
jgi:hypothetical protein